MTSIRLQQAALELRAPLEELLTLAEEVLTCPICELALIGEPRGFLIPAKLLHDVRVRPLAESLLGELHRFAPRTVTQVISSGTPEVRIGAFPILSSEAKPIGAILVFDQSERAWREAELGALDRFAKVISGMLESHVKTAYRD